MKTTDYKVFNNFNKCVEYFMNQGLPYEKAANKCQKYIKKVSKIEKIKKYYKYIAFAITVILILTILVSYKIITSKRGS